MGDSAEKLPSSLLLPSTLGHTEWTRLGECRQVRHTRERDRAEFARAQASHWIAHGPAGVFLEAHAELVGRLALAGGPMLTLS